MNVNFDKWCEKLLDAGKGNKLINYKDSQLRTLDILAPDIKFIFDKLKSGSKFSFYNVDAFVSKFSKENPNILEDNDDEPEFIKETFTKKQIIEELANKLKQTELLGYKKNYALKKVLGTIKKVSKESLNEKGLNILYMVFGFLRWKEVETNIWYISPLNLIPITLENNAASEPFYVYQYEDEISTNPTLLYKLKTDFGISLPTFEENGVDEDILTYFEKVAALVESLGWEVIKDVTIGTFSFHKMNMYNDLRTNEEEIMLNKNVTKLMNKEIDEEQEFIENIVMDDFFEENKELKLYNVVDADASQIEAIVHAKKGKSLVLQGPPGTGKSQTITNLVAEFLHDEKKILFVSEKLAALSVVQNNLSKVGLSDFCLELYSNKTNKKAVISELHRTINLDKTQLTSRVEEEVSSLIKSKNQLDKYAAELHKQVDLINKTPYELLGAASKFHSVKDFEYVFSQIENKGHEYFSEALDTIADYQEAVNIIGNDFRLNCWFGFNNKDISYQSKINLKKLLSAAINYYEPLCEQTRELNDTYQLNISNLNDLNQAMLVFKVLSSLDFFDSSMFEKKKLNSLTKLAQNIYEKEQAMQENDNEIKKTFKESFYELDLETLGDRFSIKYKSIFRIFKSGYRKDIKLIKTHLIGKKIGYKNACRLIEKGKLFLSLQKEFNTSSTKIFKILNKEFFKDKWQIVARDLTALHQVMNQDLIYFKELNKEAFKDIQEDLTTSVEVFNSLNKNNVVVNDLQNNFDIKLVSFNEDNVDELLYKLQNCIDKFDYLDFWIKFINIIDSFKALDLYDYITKSIDENISSSTLDQTFKKMFYTQWTAHLMIDNELLSKFNRISHDKTLETFKNKDKLKFKISQAQIATKLSYLRPNASMASRGGQVALLNREALKTRKQMPVRKLLSEIPELIQTLKPCFLMSPLSVSTYLDNDKIKFDVVIFDEASQIFPWDAVGAIYRAKQVVVVGDSKQMPPSNFFNAGFVEAEGEEDNYDDDSLDFESILDLCSATFDQRSLKWHYRSRVEDLIAFSNKNFYQNSLVTFPSNQNGENDGVQFYYVEDGIFNRKSKSNINEAQKVIDMIYKHYQETPNRSLGVVAFSISQQEAIDNLLQKRREKDDRFAKFFDDKLLEPFFIKNLETIQGDERDTIIFSVGYAKDSAGKFIHNFGPLNQKGGERRLNVAITRAKYNVKLVSSIRTYDIDLNKSQAEGVKLLKEYLDYAENGRSGLGIDTIKVSNKLDSEFEIEVYDVLKDAGYEVDLQVGFSGYKIDLAVKHPRQNIYILAIECDGPAYFARKSTRDRDRLRQEVLERLGWNFYRIWSTDWFKNNSIERKRLLSTLESFIKKYENTNVQEGVLIDNKEEEKKENIAFAVQHQHNEESLKDCFPLYEEANISALIKKHTKASNYGRNLDFSSFINEVVKIEQPIIEDILLKKICPAFGREKVTSVVKTEFYLKMKPNLVCKKINDYYTTDATAPIRLRLPKTGSREITAICKEEIADGLKQIIKSNIGINKDGLFKTLTNLLGFTRLGDSITLKLEEALDFLMKRREIKKENELYFIDK